MGPLSVTELESTLMHVRIITGGIVVEGASHPDFLNLDFLRNLKFIGGENLWSDSLFSFCYSFDV